MAAATAGLVVVSLAVALGAEPPLQYAERAAGDLLADGAYRDVVFGGRG
ncbi:MAG: hypothetical protein HKP18_10250 [Acidimicrobiia bacterium]|nr:hypothetical protein [Acidimicrobiia bacterium]